MNINTLNPQTLIKKPLTVEWASYPNNYLRITFNGVFTKDYAADGAALWKKEFESVKGKKVNVVFNCLHMEDYEPLARTTWQKTISELKDQIDGIYVVSNSKIISAGAAILGVFTKFSIKTVSDESQIKV